MNHDGSSAEYFRQQLNNQKYQRKDFHLPAATVDRYGWEKRRTSPNTTPASTVLNSPDLIEVHYQHQHQIKVGRSPVSQHDSLESASPLPSTENLSIGATGGACGGGISSITGIGGSLSGAGAGAGALNYDIIYDDIADNWKSNDIQTKQFVETKNSSKLTKMIGKLPIAEYDGSPRRFGDYAQQQQLHQQQDLSLDMTVRSKMQSSGAGKISSLCGSSEYSSRLSPDTSGITAQLQLKPNSGDLTLDSPNTSIDLSGTYKNHKKEENVSTFDYLYEFSETRKVLEDFFRNSEDDRNNPDADSNEQKDSGFDNNTNCAYIGQRLANVSIDEYPFHYNTIMSQSGRYNTANEIELYLDSNSHSSGELADTELDHHAKQQSTRHFTLSPESTDFDSNCGDLDSSLNEPNIGTDYARLYSGMPILEDGLSSGHASDTDNNNSNFIQMKYGNGSISTVEKAINNVDDQLTMTETENATNSVKFDQNGVNSLNELESEEIKKINPFGNTEKPLQDIQATIRDIRSTLQRTKTLVGTDANLGLSQDYQESNRSESPVWIPRRLSESHESTNSDNASKPLTPDDEDADTDLETDRLLGQQRLDDQSYHEEKTFSSAAIRQGIGTHLSPNQLQLPAALIDKNSLSTLTDEKRVVTSPKKLTKNVTSPSCSIKSKDETETKENSRNKEGYWEPSVLIEGVLFRAKYLGSTQLVCEGQPTKSTRMLQAEEAVSRIKAPEGESQPSTEVDLFISTEKIMVLNTDLKEIMMDHSLRTISYIADIGDLVVLMARRRFVSSSQQQQQPSQQTSPQQPLAQQSKSQEATVEDQPKPNRTPKMICHVFESEEAQFIAQSIGQAFQVAYMEFLKANGIEDHSFVKEMDYQEVLNSQEIFGDELEIFAKKELQKEVVVPKMKGEILGVVIVESGWGSMLPTVVIANLLSTAAAARCGQLNIGDQIIAINGLSLVGLPLSTCQNYIRNTKNQSAVKFTVVPCPPVVEVKIKRPNTKYQLGFSVQNGVICSLLRGGIAERGGVRVGHRIIEINNQSVVAVPHEKIVSLLATSVGEILMKTMPTSMFRLLTGQENPIYI